MQCLPGRGADAGGKAGSQKPSLLAPVVLRLHFLLVSEDGKAFSVKSKENLISLRSMETTRKLHFLYKV